MEPAVECVMGDITLERVDAIVNAANSSLLGGGGVDGAIHAAAGPELLRQCRELRRTVLRDGLPVGDAVVTGGGRLPCRWVIHTVGPNRHAGQTDPSLLASCFTRSLTVAAQVGAASVAFPAVSAGVYGWAAHDVAQVAVGAVREWLAAPPVRPAQPAGGLMQPPSGLMQPPSGLVQPPAGSAEGRQVDHRVQPTDGIRLVRFVLSNRTAFDAFDLALRASPGD